MNQRVERDMLYAVEHDARRNDPARSSFLCVVFLGGMVLSACSVQTVLDVGVGPYDYAVNASRVTVPTELRDDSTMTLRMIPCASDSDCPAVSSSTAVVLHCVANACDPDPIAFDLATDVIDLDANESIRQFGTNVSTIAIRDVRYDATNMGFRNAVGPTELYWGPESATAIGSTGVILLGTVPELSFTDPNGTSQGSVTLDPDGNAALSDFVLHTSHRLRLFARPRVDIAPGGPLPSGSVALHVELQVHIEGQLVR